jgi:HEAT repeat protein
MPSKISFQNALDHLLDSKKDIPQGHLKLYSDLDPKSLRLFLDIWPSVASTRKLTLLDALLSHLESDTIVSYEEIGKALLDDPDGEVRARAIRLLIESDDPKFAGKLVDIFLHDAELSPRMEAVQLLGEFVLRGELDKIKSAQQRKIEDALISVIRGEDNPVLRRRALESLGFSSRIEVATLIESAFERADPAWVASALRAMGRSQDDGHWSDNVISMLLDEEPLIKIAAIEAAGQLCIEEAVPLLLQILDDEEEDDEVAAAAIWSLSQIGGEDARTYLVALIEQNEDEDLVEFLEDALENLNFTDELNQFDLLTLDEDDVEIDEDE